MEDGYYGSVFGHPEEGESAGQQVLVFQRWPNEAVSVTMKKTSVEPTVSVGISCHPQGRRLLLQTGKNMSLFHPVVF